MSSILADPTWLALIAAIRSQPDDDLARLAAADWLDEQGTNLFGERIRQQIATGESLQLRTFESDEETVPDLPYLPHLFSNYVIRRGFIDEVTCRMEEWHLWGPEIVRHPFACVRMVRMHDRMAAPAAGWPGRVVWMRATSDNPLSWEIYSPIFTRLRGHERFPGDAQTRSYPTPAANTALSSAALTWAWTSE